MKIDREKARSMGVPIAQISDALQVYMGSAYVNDFDFNNRAYRVYVQAAQGFRGQPRDIRALYVRSDAGAMIPLDNVVDVSESTSPQVITHYNLFRSAEIDGASAPGYSSGQAIEAMDKLAQKDLPLGFSYSWSGLSLEEIKSGSQSAMLFALGLLLVYLTLSAQYESFILPFIIMLAVPMAMLGALLAQWMRGQLNDVYCQIGSGDVDRFGQQERHSDRRIRRAVAAQGAVDQRGGGGGGAHPAAADSDDVVRVHSGRAAAGVCLGRRITEPPLGGDDGVWRDDFLDGAESVLYSGAVRDREDADGAGEGSGAASS